MTSPGDDQPGGGGPRPPYPPSKPGPALDSPATSTDTVLRLAKYLAAAERHSAKARQRNGQTLVARGKSIGGLAYLPTELEERVLCQLL